MMNFKETFGPFMSVDAFSPVWQETIVNTESWDPATRRLYFCVTMPQVPTLTEIDAVEDLLSKTFSVHVEVMPRFDAALLDEKAMSLILDVVCRTYKQTSSSFNDATVVVEDHKVVITLAHGGVGLLKTTKVDEAIRDRIKDMFGRMMTIELCGVEGVDKNDEQYQEMMQKLQEEAH
ncbi:MAG: hypothetical protein IKV35_04875 [Clostridia bacterium]|nr:hypothetical protein [Clostridia bacterium]